MTNPDHLKAQNLVFRSHPKIDGELREAEIAEVDVSEGSLWLLCRENEVESPVMERRPMAFPGLNSWEQWRAEEDGFQEKLKGWTWPGLVIC